MIKLIWNECNEYQNKDVNNQIGTIVKDLKNIILEMKDVLEIKTTTTPIFLNFNND